MHNPAQGPELSIKLKEKLLFWTVTLPLALIKATAAILEF